MVAFSLSLLEEDTEWEENLESSEDEEKEGGRGSSKIWRATSCSGKRFQIITNVMEDLQLKRICQGDQDV